MVLYFIIEKNCFSVKNSHEAAQAQIQKNNRLKDAFGISQYFVDGSSLDPNRKVKEEFARSVAMAQKSYKLLQSSDEEETKNKDATKTEKRKPAR